MIKAEEEILKLSAQNPNAYIVSIFACQRTAFDPLIHSNFINNQTARALKQSGLLSTLSLMRKKLRIREMEQAEKEKEGDEKGFVTQTEEERQ